MTSAALEHAVGISRSSPISRISLHASRLSCPCLRTISSLGSMFRKKKNSCVTIFAYPHREVSTLTNELPEESCQFRFLHTSCLTNIKGSVGLILAKASVIRISIPIDLSSRSFIPLPCFIRSNRPTPLLAPSLVFSPRRSA